MNPSKPNLSSGSSLEQLQHRKTKVLSTVFVIVAAHVLPITGLLLMQGCKPDAQSITSTGQDGQSGESGIASQVAEAVATEGKELYNEFVSRESEITMPIEGGVAENTEPLAPSPANRIEPAEAPDLKSEPTSQWAIKKPEPAAELPNLDGDASGKSTSPGVVNAAEQVERKLVEHTIHSGEMLGRIAPLYQTTVKDILEANPGVDPRKLRVGQKLVIPKGSSSVNPANALAKTPAKPTSSQSNGQVHIVKSGDSLSAIAKRYGVSLTALRDANGIRTHIIHPGQELVIPVKNVASGK
jgi:LysM repeat protein